MPYADPDRQRQFNREWIASRRAEWFADKTCARCGSSDHLQLDHRDPREKVSHRIWSWSDERRNTELAKCQPLCYDCHQAKTVEESTNERCLRGHSLDDADRRPDGTLDQCRTCRLAQQRARRARQSGLV